MSSVIRLVCGPSPLSYARKSTRFGPKNLKRSYGRSGATKVCSRYSLVYPAALFAASVLGERDYYTSRTMASTSSQNLDVNSLNPDFSDLIHFASAHGPGFPVDAASISIIRDPEHFFEELVARIRTAKKTITMSSLYLGAEPKAMEMITVLDQAMAENPQLEVVILLDALRGSRNTVTPKTAQFCLPEGSPLQGVLSSVTLLYPLQIKYPERFRAFYYHTPKLHGVLKAILPERYNELVGVQHTKCYLFDDDLLISGANLSEQYFTDRQDRYVWIRENENLANFYRSLISTICGLSFRVDDRTGAMVFPSDLPDPSSDPKAFNEVAKSRMENLWNSRGALPPVAAASDLLNKHDTWLFPTIQLGHANVRHDERLTQFVLLHAPHAEPYTTYMTSPYFNIAKPYEEAIRTSNKPMKLIVASPKANGFFNGSGVSGMVPWAYDTVLLEWMRNLPQHSDIEVFEYVRDRWTFHAKGLWIEMPLYASTNNGIAEEQKENPSTSHRGARKAFFTLVGSSNFGTRSMARDLETQVAIFSTNETLGEALRKEREYIFQDAPKVTKETFEGRAENHSTLLRLVVPFASKFM